MTSYAAITGIGMAVPERILTNQDLEKMVETSDAWIRERTGIAERHVAAPGETTSSLAIAAGREALERAGIAPTDVDLVIVATCTPDRPFPATACTVQEELGIGRAGAFDLVAACSGFVYGLHIATNLIRSGAHRTVLFIAADIFTHYINWNDRSTCILFGDGAGAVVLQATDQPYGLLTSDVGSWGGGTKLMAVEAGGTSLPLTPEQYEQGKQYVYMNGGEIFKHAVREMAVSSQRVVEQAGISVDDVRAVIPHQANIRIIDAVAKRLAVPMERVVVNLDRYGNTSAASIPIALYEAAINHRMGQDDYVLLTSFGGGLTWASAVLRWGIPENLKAESQNVSMP